jgi:DNA helicase-2/ATP-dependent DNA helicase PcrA
MKKYVLKKSENSHEVDLTQPVEPTKLRIDYQKELNPSQFEAATSTEGSYLVIAGAGSGKTRTLVYRVAYLVERGVRPEQILLLTFTRKSAEEMLRRAATLLDSRCEHVAGGTFHSFANQILRQYAAVLGYPNQFTILDQSDSEDVINMARRDLGDDLKERRFPKKSTLMSMISMARNKDIPLEKFIEEEYMNYAHEIPAIKRVAEFYAAYKKEHFLMDYDDLLFKLCELLSQHESARQQIISQYRYVMIDEYQDTNKVQAQIVRLLADHGNVMAVGDDSQSIYSFRGANFKNIMNFPNIFPGTKMIMLEQNYRSTQPILNLTNQIIAGATEKYTKKLFTEKKEGELASVVCTKNEHEQSEFITQRILELREEGVELNEIAVLFRSGFLSYDLEVELTKKNIPFVKRGGFKFIETTHIKDVMAYLRVLNNPKDLISWSRILLLEEKVGPKTVSGIVEHIKNSPDPFTTTALQYKDKANVVGLIQYLAKIKNGATLSPADQTEAMIDYYAPILMKHHDDYSKRKKDLEHFQTITERFPTLNDLIVDMTLEPPSASVAGAMSVGGEEEKEMLTLSTIHSAKGLEWHTVFVIWALEGRFPSLQAMQNDDDIEEERRLMYVATTRAKQNLYITYPINIFDQSTGMVFSQASRFIDELDQKLYEKMSLVYEGQESNESQGGWGNRSRRNPDLGFDPEDEDQTSYDDAPRGEYKPRGKSKTPWFF